MKTNHCRWECPHLTGRILPTPTKSTRLVGVPDQSHSHVYHVPPFSLSWKTLGEPGNDCPLNLPCLTIVLQDEDILILVESWCDYVR